MSNCNVENLMSIKKANEDLREYFKNMLSKLFKDFRFYCSNTIYEMGI